MFFARSLAEFKDECCRRASGAYLRKLQPKRQDPREHGRPARVGVGLAAEASLQTGETPVLVRCYLQLSEMRPPRTARAKNQKERVARSSGIDIITAPFLFSKES
jgi:hypothetical protein